jgi:catechol 2,3-dioxygenase-like lactoylglutathione lyase family enzyme
MEFLGICLITNDVPALAEFYKKTLGVEAEGNEDHAELKTEGASIAIFSKEGMEKLAPNCMQGAGCGSYTIGFRVQDVDAEYKRLKSLGVEFILPPTDRWGYRTMFFRDPDGNIVNFGCPLPFVV